MDGMRIQVKCVDLRSICPQNWLPRQRPVRDQKTNFRSFISSHSSTVPANWVKIGGVDIHIVGVSESLKNSKET